MKTWVYVNAKKWQGNEQDKHATQKCVTKGFSFVPQAKFWIALINSIIWSTYRVRNKIHYLWL